MGYIAINKDYRIEVNERSFDVQKRQVYKKKGVLTDNWISETYHKDMYYAILELVRIFDSNEVDKKGTVDLKEFLQIYKKTRDDFKELLKPLES